MAPYEKTGHESKSADMGKTRHLFTERTGWEEGFILQLKI